MTSTAIKDKAIPILSSDFEWRPRHNPGYEIRRIFFDSNKVELSLGEIIRRAHSRQIQKDFNQAIENLLSDLPEETRAYIQPGVYVNRQSVVLSCTSDDDATIAYTLSFLEEYAKRIVEY